MIAFVVSLVMLELLVIRDRERLVPDEFATALIVWPAFACLAYVRVAIAGDEAHFWQIAAALYLLIIAVTGGRPALIMGGVFTDGDRLTTFERRRGRMAQSWSSSQRSWWDCYRKSSRSRRLLDRRG